MALRIDRQLTAQQLVRRVHRLFELSAAKVLNLEKTWLPSRGAPVFTIKGRYTSRGWTEWTQGFQYGSSLLQYDATGESRFLEIGRRHTFESMAAHVTHMGVHDHGFNNISTYGYLWRLMREGRIPFDEREKDFYELALKASGAVQAARWTSTTDGGGFIYSFNGPHSLFVDTLRSLRSLAVAYQLGHCLIVERDRKVNLLERLIQHGLTTARYNVYYGTGRDAYDVKGRTAHEAIFDIHDGTFRCPNSQQGYSPFTTWTRGLAWAILGFAEELEFLSTLKGGAVSQLHEAKRAFLDAATATAELYLASCCVDGVPMWDTGAPNLHRMGEYLERPSDPFNAYEPVDASAAAIAALGVIRLGNYMISTGNRRRGNHYRAAGLTVASTLMEEPYLALDLKHQGLLLHSIYHRPNGWDFVAQGQKIPNGESSMWGDYHLREVALLILREAQGESYPTFFAPPGETPRKDCLVRPQRSRRRRSAN
jgi:unsaturated chondroitin disaccharide hydrolase